MKKFIIISFFALAFVACQRDFDIGSPTEEKLCLICFPGLRDTTIIQLYRTVPIGGRYDGDPLLKDAEVVFSVNGQTRPVEQAREAVGSVPAGCWFVAEALSPGDETEITAKIDGVAPVRASAKVPNLPPVFEYGLRDKEVEVRFNDSSGSGGSYGLAVQCEQSLEIDGKITVRTRNMQPYTAAVGTREISVMKDYYDAGFTGWSLWPSRTAYYGVRVWPTSDLGGTVVKLSMMLASANFNSNLDIDYEPEHEGAIEKRRYKVLLYHFSEEFCKYMAALDHQANNAYASYGIVPMMPSFSNVSGGCGVFAGWSVRESEWFENANLK